MIKRMFNILLYTFIMLVTSLPLKEKICGIPLSADLVVGGAMILCGFICLFQDFKNIKGKIHELIKGDRALLVLAVSSAGFVLLSLASVIYARNRTAAVLETFRFLEYVFIFMLTFILCNRNEIKNVFIIFMAAMFLLGIYGLIQFVFDLSSFKDVTLFGRGRVYSTFENPNYWGAAVNLVIFVPMCLLLEKKEKCLGKKNRIILLLYFLVMFANLILCQTRAAWLGFGFGVLIIAAVRYRRAILYMIGIYVSGMLIPSLRHRFLSSFTSSSFTAGQRIKLWKTGWYMFKDHYLIGVGNGNYLSYYYEYVLKHRDVDFNKKLATVHNSYLKVLAELGILGGISFIMTYFSLASLCVKTYMRSKGILKIVALSLIAFYGAYFVHNFFNNLMFIPQLNVFVWISTALSYKYYLLETGR